MQILSLLNIVNFLLPLLWLFAILIHWLKNHRVSINLVKYGILTTIFFLLIAAAYNTWASYNLWKNDPISRYLLPPYNATYFYQYAFFHYWRPIAANLLIGAIWAGFLLALYKYSSGRILDKSEIWLGFFTAFAVGWPKIFIYMFLVFGLLLIKTIIGNFVFKDKSPVAIASNLVLSALLVMGLSDFFMKIPLLDNLKL